VGQSMGLVQWVPGDAFPALVARGCGKTITSGIHCFHVNMLP
jgi:hypothetical protein